MFRKTLLATFTTAAVAVGATSSTIAPASADIGLFFNIGQPYYGANYYGLYPIPPDRTITPLITLLQITTLRTTTGSTTITQRIIQHISTAILSRRVPQDSTRTTP